MAGNPTGIAAFVESFGNAFAHTNNQRIQQQLAVKHSQDSAIAETLIKSGMEDPTLWENENFAGPAKKVLGAQNAKAIAEIAKQYAASPMGQIKKALGEGILGAPVSAEADGPGTGPTTNFTDPRLSPQQKTGAVRERLASMTPAEAGLGISPGVGNLVRDSALIKEKGGPPSAKEQSLIDLNNAKVAHMQANEGLAQDRLKLAQQKVDADIAARVGKVPTTTKVNGRTIKVVNMSPTERTNFGHLNATLQSLDQIEQMAQDPEIRAIIGSGPTRMKRLLSKAAPGELSQVLETGGRTAAQEDFASTVARLANVDIRDIAGRAVTGPEQARTMRQVPDLTLAPDVFLARVRQARRNLINAAQGTLKTLKQSGVVSVPEVYIPLKDKEARRRAMFINKRFAGEAPAPSDAAGAPGTPAPAASPEASALDAAFLAPQ